MTTLDRLVAEKVMGWPTIGIDVDVEFGGYIRWNTPFRGMDHPTNKCEIWRPSTDIAAAWEVILRMRELGFGLDHISWSERLACSEKPGEHATGNACFVQFGREKYDAINNRHTHASGESHCPTTAICLAALGAVGMSEAQIRRAIADPK